MSSGKTSVTAQAAFVERDQNVKKSNWGMRHCKTDEWIFNSSQHKFPPEKMLWTDDVCHWETEALLLHGAVIQNKQNGDFKKAIKVFKFASLKPGKKYRGSGAPATVQWLEVSGWICMLNFFDCQLISVWKHLLETISRWDFQPCCEGCDRYCGGYFEELLRICSKFLRLWMNLRTWYRSSRCLVSLLVP